LSCRYSPLKPEVKVKSNCSFGKTPKEKKAPMIPQNETLKLLESIMANKKLRKEEKTNGEISIKKTKATASLIERLEKEKEEDFQNLENLKYDDKVYLDYFEKMNFRMQKHFDSSPINQSIENKHSDRLSAGSLKKENPVLRNSEGICSHEETMRNSMRSCNAREIVIIRKKKTKCV